MPETAYQKQWRKDNAEHCRQQAHKNYLKRKQEILVRQKARYERIKTNPEFIDKRRKYQRGRRERLRAWWLEYKASLKCVQCGESRSPCLDFHHKNPDEKEYTISAALGTFMWRKEDVMLEVDKCIVLCANCHRMHHANERA